MFFCKFFGCRRKKQNKFLKNKKNMPGLATNTGMGGTKTVFVSRSEETIGGWTRGGATLKTQGGGGRGATGRTRGGQHGGGWGRSWGGTRGSQGRDGGGREAVWAGAAREASPVLSTSAGDVPCTALVLSYVCIVFRAIVITSTSNRFEHINAPDKFLRLSIQVRAGCKMF